MGENLDRSQVDARRDAARATLAYNLKTFWILLLYIPLVVIPWVLTCVLATRPIHLPSYINQEAQYSPHDVTIIQNWMAAVRVLNSILSLVTVPLVSAILAHAAVVFTQRGIHDGRLDLHQTLTLADRGWANVFVIWAAMKKRSPGRSSFLLAAIGVLILSGVQQPLQQLLVSTEDVQIVTCLDRPYRGCELEPKSGHYLVIGYDPEPVDLAKIPRNIVVQNILKHAATTQLGSLHPNMWPEQLSLDKSYRSNFQNISGNSLYYYFGDDPHWSFYLSAFQNGTTTGILKEHALRLNYSIQCSPITDMEYPKICPGPNPFYVSYNFSDGFEVNMKACAPGNMSQVPWTSSRDRQDISEEMFMAVSMPATSFAVHCLANTTRGYFELGNYHTNYSPGKLLSSWPEPSSIAGSYNDYLSDPWGSSHESPNKMAEGPSEGSEVLSWNQPPDPFNTSSELTPGPLTTSTIALFGNDSFLYTVANLYANDTRMDVAALCQTQIVPFARLFSENLSADDPSYDRTLDAICGGLLENGRNSTSVSFFIESWLTQFKSQKSAQKALGSAMYFALEAYLAETVTATSCPESFCGPKAARRLFTSPGSAITKPSKSNAATVVISALIAIQLLALVALACYTYSRPTWTPELDALAVARMSATVSSQLPPLRQVRDEDLGMLSSIDGRVGIREEAANSESVSAPATKLMLGLGASGPITRRTPRWDPLVYYQYSPLDQVGDRG